MAAVYGPFFGKHVHGHVRRAVASCIAQNDRTVNTPKQSKRTTNVRLEPYNVITDTSTVITDYASVASTDSFFDTPYTIEGRPVFGPWPRPTFPVKSHSEANHSNNLVQPTGHDLKKSSSDATMNSAIQWGKPSELSTATISFPIIGKYSAASQKDSKKHLPERASLTLSAQTNDPGTALLESGISDETTSEHSVQMMLPILSPKEQNKLRFEQLQQRLASVTTPLASMLGTKIETSGESSTDHDYEDINEVGSTKTKVPRIMLQPASDPNKSPSLHDEILDELKHNASFYRRKRAIDLMHAASAEPSVATKTQKLIATTYQTADSQEDIHLDAEASKHFDEPNIQAVAKEQCANNLMLGIGKILRKEGGGIAALYKNSLEKPNARLSKIVYSLLV